MRGNRQCFKIFLCETFVSNEWNRWNRNRGSFTADFPLIHFGCCRIWRSFTETGISWGVLSCYCLKIFWRTKISSTTSETHGMEIWFWCGFPVMAEITHRHTFTKQISHATSLSQYFNENFYCKNCLRVFFTMTGKPAVRSLISMAKYDKYSLYHDTWLLKAWFPFTPFTYRWCYFLSENNISVKKIDFYFPEFQKKADPLPLA